jgi:hypothetical protein
MRTNFIKDIKEKIMRTKFIREKFMKKMIGVFAVSAVLVMLGLILTCENTLYKNEAKKAVPKTEEKETGGGYYTPPTVLPTTTIYKKVIKGKTGAGEDVVLTLTTKTPPTTKSVNTSQNASGVMFDIVSPSKGEEFDYTLAVGGKTISSGKVTVQEDNLTWEFKPAGDSETFTATVGGGNLKFSAPIPTGKTTIGEDGVEQPETITIGELDVEGGLWLGNGDDEEEEEEPAPKPPAEREITDGQYVLTLTEIPAEAAQNINGAMFSVNRPVLNETFNYTLVNTFDDPNKIINHGTVTIGNHTKWTFTPAVVGEPFAASVVGGYLEFDADAVIYDESELPEGEVGETVDDSSPTIIIIPKLGGGNVLAAVDEKDEEDTGEEVKIIKVTSLTLNKGTLTLAKGGTETLTAILVTDPEDAEVKIWWGSSKSAVASVTQNGEVTAKKGGTVTIKAIAGTVTAECKVTVPLDAGLYIGESSDPVDLSLAEGETVTITKALAWINTNGVNDGQYTILLGKNETEETSVGYEIKGDASRKNLKITLRGLSSDAENPVTITKNAAGPLFSVYGSTSTNTDDVPELILENITLKGYGNDTTKNTSALVVVGKLYGGSNYYKGKLTMREGSRITGNIGSPVGGGIRVFIDSAFTMENGNISGNTTTTTGGGVTSAGDFTMTGGVISGNTATGNGGGVYVATGVFIMDGGNISGNTSGNMGGGVNATKFTMTDGVISDNTAKNGGGVATPTNAANYFTMEGGSIEGNRASNLGAAYCQYRYGTFTKTGGVIYGVNPADATKANKGTEGTSGIHAISVDYTTGSTHWYDLTAGEDVSLGCTLSSSTPFSATGEGWDTSAD